MTAASVKTLYEKHYAGEKARFFHALAAWRQPERVLYPGSFIHVTASFVFPSVVYVDNDRNAKRFFSEMDDVVSFVARHKVYGETPEMVFHGSSYEADIPEPDGSFDLLISLYAGFISKPCKRYLKPGGVLAVNNSHGDAGLASIDPNYELVGVIQGRGDRLRVVEENLDTYFKPKKETKVTEELLRELNRGIGYTKTASAQSEDGSRKSSRLAPWTNGSLVRVTLRVPAIVCCEQVGVTDSVPEMSSTSLMAGSEPVFPHMTTLVNSALELEPSYRRHFNAASCGFSFRPHEHRHAVHRWL